MRLFTKANFLALTAALLAAPAHAQSVSDVLECSGPFAKSANEAGLIKAFGAANVVQEDIDVGEGSTEPGSVIYPKDPKRRIEVLWHEAEKRQRPSSITVQDPSTWAITAGLPDQRRITVGTRLAQVEAINGKPFLIYGFGWDNGGYAGGWEGGAMEMPPHRAASRFSSALIQRPRRAR